MNTKLEKSFAAPGSACRGMPFWAWNGDLKPDELRRQIRLMKSMGLGGFFMHSRVGLSTPYLQNEWFECVKACIDEAQKQDMQAWIYDEDRWPSGAAGGLVTKNPKYRMRALWMRKLDRAQSWKWDGVLAAFAGRIADGKLKSVRPLKKGAKAQLEDGETALLFEVHTDPPREWYNGYTYLDTLNPEAVKEFIRVTHEAYRKRVGKSFGNVVPGVFTDEPNYGKVFQSRDKGTAVSIPWTGALEKVFKQRCGCALLPHLPELFFDVEGMGISKARYHYYDCLTHLFTTSFSKQCGEWCGKNNLQFTGHALEEDSLSRQTTHVGSCMRFYEYMQAPGMDLLTEHWRIYDTAKQVSSVARQFGRKWRLTETYGCTGWDFPFSGHKALGDWQVALGINLRCQHLSWYTMEGEAKRDYPAAIFYQSPWWQLYSAVEDYFARVIAVMTRGEEVRDLLVIHPIESMWTLMNSEIGQRVVWPPAAAEPYDISLVKLRAALLDQHVDFDYGDEEMLSRHGRVLKGKNEPQLCLAKASYKAVVVPPLITMRASTLALLKKFKAAGGRVIFAGPAPEYIDAEPSKAAVEFAAGCVQASATGKDLADAAAPLCRRLSIADKTGAEIAAALYLLREDAEAFYLFICNTGHTPEQLKITDVRDDPRVTERTAVFPDVFIRGFEGCAGSPVELDPNTGSLYAANAQLKNGAWEIKTDLPALGSRLFVVPKKKDAPKYPSRPAHTEVRRSQLPGGAWKAVLSESNNLVLDCPRCKIGSGDWQPANEILIIDREVRTALGALKRGGQMVQPWARTKSGPRKSVAVELVYEFGVSALPSGDLFLAVERPETFELSVNGSVLNRDVECGWWVDQSLRKIPVDPACLHLGKNEVRLRCAEYSEDHSGLEMIYLLGNFGTTVKGTAVSMTEAPRTLQFGDWTEQGLAFYSGHVAYCQTIQPRLNAGERLFVQIPKYEGTAVRIWVNGKVARVIAWEPNEADITGLLDGESAELRIEVIGHRRNSHGPFNVNKNHLLWTGPGEYCCKTGNPAAHYAGYQRVPCGLMEAPVLSVRK